MDSLHLMYSFLFVILILFKDVSSLTISVSQTMDKAILGDNPFTLSCTYTLGSLEQFFSIELQRKRESDTDFTTIVTFLNPSSPLNVTYAESSLESRTVATKPTEESKTATFVFNTIECDDKATYKWKAFYFDGTNKNVEKTSTFTVKVNTLFGQEEHRSLSYVPSTNLEEGDDVVFTCSGDVGNEPVGHLGWFYYLGNDTSNAINASSKATSTAPVYVSSTCSYTRTSTLQLKMVKEFNDILVRCTVQQDKYDQHGDGHVQTENIPVYYSPKITAIEDRTVAEGTELLTLTCKADAYPAPFYSWLLPNGTVTDGPGLTLTSLQMGDNGTYTCVVYNTFKSNNHTVNETAYIDIRKTTTPPPTTTTTPSTGSTGGGAETTKKPAPATGGDDNKSTIYIVVGVVLGLLVIIGVVVIILCVKKRNKPKEIEEPPEKPRNNQDLSFYGNRPDLVSADHGMKNNMGSALNSSFNNSFDSSSDVKSRNEDGLFDVQFDDKPRSRRPIQLLDNMSGSGSYGDIVNPRV
ncbi:cell adhesion molecule 1-like isoform X1 [Mercenaria mercenaria]|uniref:cell adhesion molecule 1-like isoform X1 n=1 Tax=Mercenaria mercenaria TaxID=6596 RepID=UPI00234F1666|nr:cell adhesion molecule 1-like isoform X1 [Mercenaria mercenaria]